MSGSISRAMYGAMKAGVEVLIHDKVTLHLPASACTSPILVLSLTQGVHITHRDAVPENQVMFIDISDKLVSKPSHCFLTGNVNSHGTWLIALSIFPK